MNLFKGRSTPFFSMLMTRNFHCDNIRKMCFSIPSKVKNVGKGYALTENGNKIILDKSLRVKPGEYLQVAGNVAVRKLTKNQGLKVRSLIKSLN